MVLEPEERRGQAQCHQRELQRRVNLADPGRLHPH